MSGRDSFDLTPQQYHDGLDKLWSALGLTEVQGEDVFTLAARELLRLRAAALYTRDGVLIVDGMKVYEPPNPPFSKSAWPARVCVDVSATDRPFLFCGHARDDIDPALCYSTREAAEAAGVHRAI